MNQVVILGASRTPIGDFQGALKDLSAIDLAMTAVQSALERSALSANLVDEVAMGMIYKQGLKGNPARQVQLRCGMPASGWAHTVDQQCASGMRAFENILRSIQAGVSSAGVAAGAESMSNAPYVLMRARGGYRMGDGALVDSMLNDGLVCAMEGTHMGVTAENLARQYGITRQEQDELAVLSHRRAARAVQQGIFADEIVSVPVKTRQGEVFVTEDEHPRPDLTTEKLSRLRPAFLEDGAVTAGNASSINDGAAALVLAEEGQAKLWGLPPLSRVLAVANAGVDPSVMGIGPVYAIQKALKMTGLDLRDIGCFEINEAFAAQFIACNRELKLDMELVNQNGSGIGLGHPVGCTGARILVSLVYQMRRIGCRYGVAALCVGGGPAMAVVLERVEQ